MQIDKLNIARVSTVPFFVLTQLKAQIEALSSSGMRVTVIASRDEMSDKLASNKNFTYVPVNIERAISPSKDFISLIALNRVFKKLKFDIVHSTTPKAGLLSAIAGYFAKIPVRLHTFTGQPWVTTTGIKRSVLMFCDKIIARLNTHCYADSASQRDFLISSGIVSADKISVIGAGSLAGIDLERFDPCRYSVDELRVLRDDLNIPDAGKILLFVGRITPDKGIGELLSAFSDIVKDNRNVFLVLVGPFESVGENVVNQIDEALVRDNIRTVGFSSEPEKYMALADLLCLPSYREGFGTVVIEAAAMGTPAIGSDIYGLSDAIVNGKTGILVPVRDSESLKEGILCALNDLNLLSTMGVAAQDRAIRDFGSKTSSELLMKEYKRFFN
ncbi:glycosyltransferase family 4 protein [Pseudomonas sp. NKUCC02_KPG]|uniref:glycosyltransferase family 4 protein n=1 Tax=Pseudomonas sp. NKUCC02_KPG TaxID=2842124 RepID=UPI001C5B3718|nr:glycosyltransferase family 4 protein [Pseudomonas sp. NKUCC02_KPG]